MSREYDNTDRGVLFVNDRKSEQAEGAPDYRGNINIEGKEYWLSGWKKKIKSGDREGEVMLSLSVQEKEEKPKKKSPQKKKTAEENDADPTF